MIEVGAPITYVAGLPPSLRTAYGTVDLIDETHLWFTNANGGPYAAPVGKEGVWWARGHHPATSEDAQALLVAATLAFNEVA